MSFMKKKLRAKRIFGDHFLVDVIKFLFARGLPFRGHDEKFGSQKNGNYMGILGVVAKYDPFLAMHIEKKGNTWRGKCVILVINYL